MSSRLSGKYKAPDGTHFYIRENSFIAKIAAKKLRVKSVAIVTGNTINLYNKSKEDFLQDIKWLLHELCHVQQYKKHGYIPFILKYLLSSLHSGYYNNKYEVEARNAENP